jgi:hypothetical protein
MEACRRIGRRYAHQSEKAIPARQDMAVELHSSQLRFEKFKYQGLLVSSFSDRPARRMRRTLRLGLSASHISIGCICSFFGKAKTQFTAHCYRPSWFLVRGARESSGVAVRVVVGDSLVLTQLSKQSGDAFVVVLRLPATPLTRGPRPQTIHRSIDRSETRYLLVLTVDLQFGKSIRLSSSPPSSSWTRIEWPVEKAIENRKKRTLRTADGLARRIRRTVRRRFYRT